MPDHSVKEYLPQAPFPIAGRLSFELGEDRFVELSIHDLVKNNIVSRRMSPISIWSLVGPYGIGRTWTMAWLGREARYENMGNDDERWEAALVPGLGSDGSSRTLFESIFRSTEYLRDEVREALVEEESQEWDWDSSQQTPTEAYMNDAVRDEESWAVLTGTSSRFPELESTTGKPKWTQRETQLDFLAEWFKWLGEIGVDHLPIFIDEFELLATNLSKNKLVELSDGLRSLFDKIESTSENLPNIQVIFSLTPEGAADIESSYGAEGIAGWVRPLQSRMNTPIAFEKIDEREATDIARKGIPAARVIDAEDAFTPYTEEAVSRAATACDGLPRTMSDLLNRMHQLGYDKERIDSDVAEEAIGSLDIGEDEMFI